MIQDAARDHGGGRDAARARWGGQEKDWLDLSTGINPVPYPLPTLASDDWTRLPDHGAETALIDAARAFWRPPDAAAILAVPGLSAAIARLPGLAPRGSVAIPGPTYNEHAAAFRAHGWTVTDHDAEARVLVHPNNPDGRLWAKPDATAALTVIDESFCDVLPGASLIALAARPGTVILKSFGKFWGLAGLRLGFVIGLPATIDPLRDMLGPWPISGPALRIGAIALRDADWAVHARARLAGDAARLDALLAPHGAIIGGTDLFRLLRTPDAPVLHDRLGRAHILTRTFPYAADWLRVGLPDPAGFDRLAQALE